MEAQQAAKVYVVDDERMIASAVCAMLTWAGFEARAFAHPADLLRVASVEGPDVVISDVMMPEMNGLDLALRLQIDHPECKVLLFSGHVDTSDLLQAARAHGYEFEVMSKPVQPEELLNRVRALVGERQPALVGH